MKTTQMLIQALLALLLTGCAGSPLPELTSEAVSVPVAGNTYVTAARDQAKISRRGIDSWEGDEAVLSLWFKVSQTGSLHLFLKSAYNQGEARLQVSCLGKDFPVTINQPEETVYPVGIVEVKQPGYIRVDLKGVSKQGTEYPHLAELLIDGEAAAEPLNFVRNFETYWGLRGPSVHLKYTLPEEDVEYFYNEITVPEGEDVTGSYFMANGFGEGYCGIQVNSETERRILFSVWSPFNTDNPEEIPEDEKIRLLGKGEGVYTGEFGNEGSGGQSYLVYPWKAGITYRFLTQVRPDGKGNTQYHAWFYDPEIQEWKMVAGFSRPKTDTWYKGAHSFLENFITQQGYITRKVNFGNQWVRTAQGEWIELTEAQFTYDATAAAQVRVDYAGGLDGDRFFLKNCGFFNENTEYKQLFTRPAKGMGPNDAELPIRK